MAAMAAVLPYLSAVGAAFSVVSALNQGQNAKNAADRNAQINQQNANIAQQNATDQARQQQRETYLRLGQIRANQGKSGGTGDTGSVLDVLGDVAAQGELERQDILYRGELQARGYNNTAALDTASGENAVTSSYFKAGSELLSGAAKSYDYYDAQQKRDALKRVG